ncbi:hypothetical protein Nepgr_000119 [Nepenthes gracilis]|uniref:HTH myb-type domain-containing protein n=1 Tax=Nepenthes gracilis TaxID=150966 RepID=A0AAD3RWF1_NEPGR|nr:hypothetical protein Nepgr_000119 [Nepenthes gracilis]
MGEEMRMTDYCGVDYEGGSGGDEDRVLEWEVGLPGASELTPLSQALIPPDLASAFNVKPEPFRTVLDVKRASQNTLSSLRGQTTNFAQSGFKSFDENHSPVDVIVDDDEDRSDSKKLRRTESVEEADSALRTENSNLVDDQSARALKRSRLVWTPQLHKRFVDVVAHLGIKNAVPKTIMQLMNVEGLTRENVASHLQKYRLYLKRMQGFSSEGPTSPDQVLSSAPVPQNPPDGGNTVHGDGHVPMPILMPYGQPMMPMPVMGMAHYGHMGIPMVAHGMGNYNNGLEKHHHHPYGMMQQREWSGNNYGSVVNSCHPHASPTDK